MFATEDEVRRKYGVPGATVERSAVYASDGIAFVLFWGQVGGSSSSARGHAVGTTLRSPR